MFFQFKLHKLKTFGAFNDFFDNEIFYNFSPNNGHLSHGCVWYFPQLWHDLITALISQMISRIET
jgi:hypothetical protein